MTGLQFMIALGTCIVFSVAARESLPDFVLRCGFCIPCTCLLIQVFDAFNGFVDLYDEGGADEVTR